MQGSTVLKPNGTNKTLFKRFPIHRIENKAGEQLSLTYTRDTITDLLNIEFSSC